MSKEPEIRAELYRVLKNVVERGVRWGNYEVISPAVEFPVNDEKADLVVFFRYLSASALPSRVVGPVKEFLVIETKSRCKYPSKPLGKATEQVINYAKKIQCRFFAVYDGWNFLLFETVTPYLIKLSNFHRMDDFIARNLLTGLLQYYQKGRNEGTSLDLLPKVPDGWSFWQVILPIIAKSIASITGPELAEAWKIDGQWFRIIKRDAEW